MKKYPVFFLAFFMLFAVTPCLAQFNDVKKKILLPIVGTHAVPRGSEMFKNPYKTTGNETAVTTADSTAAERVEAEDSIRSFRPLFSHPLEGKTLDVTSHYGYREDPISGKRKFHKGTDFRTCTENVYAMMPGRIRKIGYDKRLGNYIRIEHGDWEVTYGHLHTVRGRKGDFVNAGYSVGISGSTGRSTGEHLHVGVEYKGKSIDPYPFILYVVDHASKARRPSLRAQRNPISDGNSREKDQVALGLKRTKLRKWR